MNAYTPTWFELFMDAVEPAQTGREVAFLRRLLPLPEHRRILDVCCGTGRHAAALAAVGYEVLGIDRDAGALAAARRAAGPGTSFLQADVRDLAAAPGEYDAALVLWQSFGYFDDATNAAVLRDLAAKLRPGGRLVLDVYRRAFFERYQGERRFERGGLWVSERKRMVGPRLRVDLDYGPGREADAFDWRLFEPEELLELARAEGLACHTLCSGFDEGRGASADDPRMQLVLERGSDPWRASPRGAELAE